MIRFLPIVAKLLAMNEPALYVVATPIGNLGDMVPRAVETLQTVDVIAAEDTRHSAKLLEHFHIKTPLVAYHDHSDATRTAQLVARIQQGQRVALISDAGTPLVSDPGYQLVAAARRVVLARELTKTFETFLTGTAAQVLQLVTEDSNQQRGEIVLLVAGAPKPERADSNPEAERVMALLAAELPPKKASALAEQITGVKKKALYQWYVDQQ
jgi:16S rRNA C1402 (ribose-2'-O) methylase RsmI